MNKDLKNLRSNSLQQGENDKGLIPTKNDGPWHMLRRTKRHVRYSPRGPREMQNNKT